MAATSSGYGAAATPGNMFSRLMDTAMFDVFNVTSSTVAIVTTARPPSPTQISPEQPAVSAVPTEEDYVVLPGPEDVLLFNSSNGLYQQSVTLTARMYPIEATAAKSIWGLPTLIWGILIGTIVILIVILATLFFCCWLQPRTRKLLSASYYATNTGSNVSHSSIVPKSQTSDSNQLVMPLSIGICPPQYSAPPPPGSGNNSGTSNQQQICSAGTSSGIPCHGSNVSPAAVHHGGANKYGSSPHQQQYAHQQQQQQQQYHQQQQQYQHHHQCIHHQQQQQQYQAHYAHLQQQQQQQQQQQSYQQYYNQQQQQHQQQQQQQQQLTQYIHPAQQQALQQQQREHQIQQQQHHYHHHQQQQQQQQQQQKQQKQQSQLVHHKSMWAINPLYASSGVISDGGSSGGGGGGGFGGGGPDGRDGDEEAGSTSYRTRSLPSWGKNRQRPLSNADDLEELYAKVNFSKKRRNRMRNDEAAIIALCRSRSQNLAALPMAADQDAVVVYDERTAL